jgi:two-component system, cell cycle sensor histidine kinase and response regulator CckA
MENYLSTFFPNGHEKAILVVDDYPTNRQTVACQLNRLGFQNVITATNGHEALQIYCERKDEILLVLSDIHMPIMRGDELFWNLRKADEKSRIVLMTGNRNGYDLGSFFKAGLKGFLDKPFSFEELGLSLINALM